MSLDPVVYKFNLTVLPLRFIAKWKSRSDPAPVAVNHLVAIICQSGFEKAVGFSQVSNVIAPLTRPAEFGNTTPSALPSKVKDLMLPSVAKEVFPFIVPDSEPAPGSEPVQVVGEDDKLEASRLITMFVQSAYRVPFAVGEYCDPPRPTKFVRFTSLYQPLNSKPFLVGDGSVIGVPPDVNVEVLGEAPPVALSKSYVTVYVFPVQRANKVIAVVCGGEYGKVIAVPPSVADQPANV
jgi:hypothetical protein